MTRRMLACFLIAAAPLFWSGCAGRWYWMRGHGFRLVEQEKYKIDADFVDEIWAQIKKDIELPADLKRPVITISNKDSFIGDDGAEVYMLGRYDVSRKEITVFFKVFFLEPNISEKTRKVLIYDTIAHELLHYALDKKWSFYRGAFRSPDHCVMLNKGYLERILDFIDARFKDSGEAKEISMRNLEGAYEKENCK